MDSRVLEKLGADPNYPEDCPECGSNGVVVVSDPTIWNCGCREVPCENCGGTGYVDDDDRIMEDYKLRKGF